MTVKCEDSSANSAPQAKATIKKLLPSMSKVEPLGLKIKNQFMFNMDIMYFRLKSKITIQIVTSRKLKKIVMV